jgi:hypothetical protein
MKASILSALLLVVLLGCNEDDATPTKPIDDDFDPTEATLLKSGTLVGVGHTVSGTASLFQRNDSLLVVLDPFSSQNGPDLKVYFSKDVRASSYLSLGALKSTTGKQTYFVPGKPAVTEYMFVHVWCEAFSVEFARAELK